MTEKPPSISREEVVMTYRLLLGRFPESEQVIENHRRAHASFEAFLQVVHHSEEFRQRIRALMPELPPPLDTPPPEGEVMADPVTLRTLLAHTARYWTRIGQAAPHWSVLTEERFAPGQISAHRDAFFASGESDARMLDAILARSGRDRGEFEHCAEYGCGVGRTTVGLAQRFARVTALDLSQPHLDQAATELQARQITNVELRLVTPEALMPAADYDLWYSRIVLQHNPPPIIIAVLRRAFLHLRPGGMAVFQVPTWMKGYAFSSERYLAGTPGDGMEMHAVPQAAVLELAAAHGMVLRDIREDSALVGRPGKGLSNTFAFEKRGWCQPDGAERRG